MKNEWSDVVITKICGALYVPPNTGTRIHKDRPFHGFVLNTADSDKTYVFSDGRVMNTYGCYLFYLPKGSSYEVKTPIIGGCYAINFDAEIADDPFAIKLRNAESVRKRFHTACNEWKTNSSVRNCAAMEAIYDAIFHIQKEIKAEYMTTDKLNLIEGAVEEIEQHFNLPSVSIAALAEGCGISEVYFRKIFIQRFGISPKEYIIQKRMDFAKRLLLSGELGISETAELCGYTEPCHFSREFKKHFGVSPKNFK